jgi:hypothetical protein
LFVTPKKTFSTQSVWPRDRPETPSIFRDGIYEVFFTGDVSNGAFVATIGRPGIATEPPGEITMALRCCPGLGLFEPFEGNKGVWIQTFDSAGKPSDRSFHLIVLTH